MRETMDEVALAELADSIGAVGVLEPLVVEKHGDRFQVMAGHRRLIACGLVGVMFVPCIVRPPGSVDSTAVTVAENYYREDVNPAEEAVFLDKLLTERCNGDVDVLAALIRHRREYVEDRLLLLRHDPQVLDALRDRRISLAVARELNRVKDAGQRAVYLDAAISGGATASVVRTWRSQGELLPPTEVIEPAAGDPAANGAAAAEAYRMECLFCGEGDEPHTIEIVYLHRNCKKFLTRLLDQRNAGA